MSRSSRGLNILGPSCRGAAQSLWQCLLSGTLSFEALDSLQRTRSADVFRTVDMCAPAV